MTTTAIPSLDVNDFKSNIQDFDAMANGAGVYTDRFGKERLTLDEFMRRNGYEVPVAFASGIAVSRTTQTVTYNGVTYHALATAIPFTTTGTFNPAQWEVISGVSREELASATGASLISHMRPEQGVSLFSIGTYHNRRALNAAVDFGLDFSGATDQTSKFATMVDSLTEIALTNGRCPAVALPYGRLRIDGNITLLPFMRFYSEGPLDLLCLGNNGVSFWVKNNIAIPQPGGEADYNLGPVFDGSHGLIRVIGNATAGSEAFRFGSPEGSASSGLYTAFAGLRGMHLNNFDKLIYFTNNNVFANRFELVKMTNAKVAAVSNSATAPVNGGELIDFRGCFINNSEIGIQTNAEIEIAYSGGSISFTKKPIRMNGNNIAVLHLDNVHFEKFGADGDDALIQSTATSNTTQPTVMLSANIIPTSYRTDMASGSVLRTMMKGKLNLNIEGLSIHSDTFKRDGTEFQFLCDSDVSVRGAANARIGSGIFANMSPVSRVPDSQCTSTSRYTAGANTVLTQVSGGTPSRTALSITSPGAQRSLRSDYFPVVSDERIFASALVDVSATTAGAKVNMRLNWYYHDKTLIGSTSYVNSDLSPVIGTSGWKHAYFGTGRQTAPAGAAYATVELATDSAFAGTMLLTSFIAGTA